MHVQYAILTWINTELRVFKQCRKGRLNVFILAMSMPIFCVYRDLKERRDRLCKKYFQNIMETIHRLNYLLPCQRCNKYDVRRINKYQLPEIRTNRYRNSLLPWRLYHWQWFLLKRHFIYVRMLLLIRDILFVCITLRITLRHILLPCILYACMYCIFESNSVEL